LLTCSASAKLDLTPGEGEKELDGAKIHQLVFLDGGQRITYSPPRGWQYSGGGNRLGLRPGLVPDAEASIRVVDLVEPQVLDAATTKKLTAAAMAGLPGGAVNVALISEDKNPILIEQKETFLVVLHYDYYGVSYARSLLFVNRRNEQLQFQLTAPRKSFPQLQKEFFGSQFSWENL
jgi:hypothetical protein